MSGLGIDNHLVALRELAKQAGKTLPIFADDMFREIFRFPLSTSQVPTNIPGSYVCYGPVVPDGYGSCYNPMKDNIVFAISAFKSCSKTDAWKFRDNLKEALDETKMMLENCQ